MEPRCFTDNGIRPWQDDGFTACGSPRKERHFENYQNPELQFFHKRWFQNFTAAIITMLIWNRDPEALSGRDRFYRRGRLLLRGGGRK